MSGLVRIPETADLETPAPQPEKTVGKTSIQKVVCASCNKLRVIWTKAAGATGYRVYRSTSAKGGPTGTWAANGYGTVTAPYGK